MGQRLPLLYTFRRCPYAIRARLAIYSAKVEVEQREVDLKNKPDEMLSISPKGTVPVLQLSDGTVLEESLEIMKWAVKNPSLSSEDSELITENDTTFKYALDRYKYPGRYDEEAEVNYRDVCEAFLKKLETRLNPFLNGECLTFVDMAIFPFIRQFANVDPEWFQAQPYPHLKKWMHVLLNSDLFLYVMRKEDAL